MEEFGNDLFKEQTKRKTLEITWEGYNQEETDSLVISQWKKRFTKGREPESPVPSSPLFRTGTFQFNGPKLAANQGLQGKNSNNAISMYFV